MSARITHAHAPMPDLEVIDLNTGKLIEDVVEVDSDKGWLKRRVWSGLWLMGHSPADLVEERGRFRIRRKGCL